jgi:hypothetical protein
LVEHHVDAHEIREIDGGVRRSGAIVRQ